MTKSDLTEVFAGNLWQVTMIKSLLDNADIGYFVKDELMGTLEPWNTDAGGAGAIKIFVLTENLDEALQIVKEYRDNLNKEG